MEAGQEDQRQLLLSQLTFSGLSQNCSRTPLSIFFSSSLHLFIFIVVRCGLKGGEGLRGCHLQATLRTRSGEIAARSAARACGTTGRRPSAMTTSWSPSHTPRAHKAATSSSPPRTASVHTAHGTRHTAHGTRHTAHGTRHTAHGTRHTAHGTRHTAHARAKAYRGWAGEMHLGGFMASGKAYIESRRITHVINAAVRHTRSALFSVLHSCLADLCAHDGFYRKGSGASLWAGPSSCRPSRSRASSS
jgi:hypothetical protein